MKLVFMNFLSKTNIQILTMLLFVAIIFSSCKEDELRENAYSCNNTNLSTTVNTADGSFQSCNVTSSVQNDITRIHATSSNDDAQKKQLIISFKGSKPGTYSLGKTNSGIFEIGKYNIHQYTTDTIHTGKVIVSSYDTTSHIMNGSFEFNAFKISPSTGFDTTSINVSGTFNYLVMFPILKID